MLTPPPLLSADHEARGGTLHRPQDTAWNFGVEYRQSAKTRSGRAGACVWIPANSQEHAPWAACSRAVRYLFPRTSLMARLVAFCAAAIMVG
jgi:hypothetical protein